MKTIFAHARMRRACALAFGLGLAGQAWAAEPPLLEARDLTDVPAREDLAQAFARPAEIKATPNIGGEAVAAVDLERLEHERGKADTVLNDTKLNGDVANNSAVNVNTGSNTIDAGSFANMSGIPVVIQNSGANVLIQNATVINLQFQ
jgi:hypothetical protein